MSSNSLIEKQDEKLHLISSYISNLKNTANVIGEIIDEHNNELDSITIDVENNTDRINSTTNKIEIFRKKVNNNFCMIFILFILIDVVLTVVYFKI
jgi:t-SNARE complex subunit (syntaxin)